MMALMVLPLWPTTSPIFCGSIWICTIFGANFAYLFTRLADAGLHAVVHNVETCLAAARDSALYDGTGQAVDLDIHLDGC